VSDARRIDRRQIDHRICRKSVSNKILLSFLVSEILWRLQGLKLAKF
jgi:hypothetical protein